MAPPASDSARGGPPWTPRPSAPARRAPGARAPRKGPAGPRSGARPAGSPRRGRGQPGAACQAQTGRGPSLLATRSSRPKQLA
eukprot:8007528-Lingulodinium_polyedra.AAC.2